MEDRKLTLSEQAFEKEGREGKYYIYVESSIKDFIKDLKELHTKRKINISKNPRPVQAEDWNLNMDNFNDEIDELVGDEFR